MGAGEFQVSLYVRDPEVSAAFYSRHFGFVESFRYPASGTAEHIEVKLNGQVLGFGSIEAAKRVHGIDVASSGVRCGVVIWVDDADAAYARLIAGGATSLNPPHDFLEAKLRNASVLDPDGNPVEVVQSKG